MDHLQRCRSGHGLARGNAEKPSSFNDEERPQAFPAGEQSNGVTWQSLGMFSTSTGTLSVRLGDNANGYVIADAIRLVKDGITPQRPEMDVAALARSISAR